MGWALGLYAGEAYLFLLSFSYFFSFVEIKLHSCVVISVCYFSLWCSSRQFWVRRWWLFVENQFILRNYKCSMENCTQHPLWMRMVIPWSQILPHVIFILKSSRYIRGQIGNLQWNIFLVHTWDAHIREINNRSYLLWGFCCFRLFIRSLFVTLDGNVLNILCFEFPCLSLMCVDIESWQFPNELETFFFYVKNRHTSPVIWLRLCCVYSLVLHSNLRSLESKWVLSKNK